MRVAFAAAFLILAPATTIGVIHGSSAAARGSSASKVAFDVAPKTIRVGITRSGGGYDVRTMNLEEYVAGVLVGEAARDSSPAALQALAITIRTFALANINRHRADGFDMCDQTHCQVLRRASQASAAAAEATAGRVLLYKGAPASVFYTASCGGHTERPSAVWPGADDSPFLPSREDDACEGQPAWSTELASEDLLRALKAGGYRGRDLRDLRVAGRNDSGRVTRLRLDGLEPDQISGQDLRTVVGRTLGWQFIKSTSFDLQRTSSGFRFSGRGSGHGVGLCVIGSARLGAKGRTPAEILARYFPGLEISSGPVMSAPVRTVDTGIVISLPAGDEGERDVIRSLAARSSAKLAEQTGVTAPARMVLRFHPTVDSYQRATSQPWFTASATVRDEMHFAPLTVLRDRGVLEETVRHEMAHLMIDPILANRPLWVREGAAAYFAGEKSAELRGSCPTDDELRNPVSPGALRTAYARATACFARQLAAGRKWTEIK
ncbi:MAG TPA: SpoIID/LytB domain-containing protein [Vicinamibacterales bacterium]